MCDVQNVFVSSYLINSDSKCPPGWSSYVSTKTPEWCPFSTKSDSMSVLYATDDVQLAVVYYKNEMPLDGGMQDELKKVGATSLCTIEYLRVNPEHINLYSEYSKYLLEHIFETYPKAMFRVDCLSYGDEYDLYSSYGFLSAGSYENHYIMLKPPQA